MPVFNAACTQAPGRTLRARRAPPDVPAPCVGAGAGAAGLDGVAGAAAAPLDAIALLQADHRAVDLLFAEYEGSRSAARRKALVAEICAALKVRGQIEEEIFYPEVKTALKDPGLVPQATAGHRTVMQLIVRLQATGPAGPPDAATVGLLAASVQRHVREANEELFPQAKASALDMEEIGERMAARRDDLLLKAA
jgi:hypothetical protein